MVLRNSSATVSLNTTNTVVLNCPQVFTLRRHGVPVHFRLPLPVHLLRALFNWHTHSTAPIILESDDMYIMSFLSCFKFYPSKKWCVINFNRYAQYGSLPPGTPRMRKRPINTCDTCSLGSFKRMVVRDL